MDFPDLQKRQQRHDEISHRDILDLPLERRIAHHICHLVKYTGRLLAISLTNDDADRRQKIERTLADTMLICLAFANACGVDLSKVKKHAFNFGSKQHSEREEVYLLRIFVIATAGMSKIYEDHDHGKQGSFQPSSAKTFYLSWPASTVFSKISAGPR